MTGIFTEENGKYRIDCSNAIWATDEVHKDYQNAGLHINDTDFLIENESCILMIEYKNANIASAVRPEAFNPTEDNKISNVTRKFYDSLHYLKLKNKTKTVQYVYILEYPNGDTVTRKRIRNKLKKELPFALQDNIGDGIKLIDKVDVVSIEEWNENKDYGKYPISPVNKDEF